jgi:putative DNA primase/helicase
MIVKKEAPTEKGEGEQVPENSTVSSADDSGSVSSAQDQKVESRSLVPPDPEPWPEQVDGAELLDGLVAVFHRHLSLPEGAAEIFALWVLFAHAFKAVDVSPRLILISPEPECGKTTALSLLGRLVPRRILASNVTTAVIFRAIERYRPTMLIDEADTFIDAGDEIAGILNSGHQPETAFVWRCDGDDHEARGFSTWSPLAIARIGDDLPAPLRSRSIVIRMQRARCDEDLERLRAMHHAGLDDLCRKGARWAVDHLDVLRDADPEMPEALTIGGLSYR